MLPEQVARKEAALRRLLEAFDGEFTRSTEIGLELGCSRRTVFRYIKELKARGHKIKGESGFGYFIHHQPRSGSSDGAGVPRNQL
jgi:biotin operon repressor